MIDQRIIEQSAAFIFSNECDRTRNVCEIYNAVTRELGVILSEEADVMWLCDYIHDIKDIPSDLSKAFLF